MKKGWQTKRLGEVCEIIKGRKPTLKATPSNSDLPYLVAKVMRGSAEAEYASVKDRNSITVEETETIIICDGSNSGEVFTGFRGILSSTMGKIAKKSEIDDNYLRAFLASTFEVFNGAKTGSAIPHLDKEAMYRLEFPHPPLAEQQRIVGILDEVFEGIATAKTNAEKNLQNARDLFESHLQSVFTQRGEDWVEKRLGKLCGIGDGNYSSKYPKASEFLSEGVPFLTATNLKNGTIADDGLRFISPQQHSQLTKGHVKTGDLVVVVRGSGTGNSSIVPDRFTGANLNSQLAFLRSHGEITAGFLFFAFNSPPVQEAVRRQISGAAQPQLPNNKLLDIPVSYPSRDLQEVMVGAFCDLQEETQRLATIYERKLAALDDLKKSLLHQAFSGQL
jgi:type I restriction enzyme S subunit